MIKVYIAGRGILDIFGSYDPDLNLMTFIYELHPYWLEVHWTCEQELSTSRFSKVII